MWWDEAFIWNARATNWFHETGETRAPTIEAHTVDFVTRTNKHARQAIIYTEHIFHHPLPSLPAVSIRNSVGVSWMRSHWKCIFSLFVLGLKFNSFSFSLFLFFFFFLFLLLLALFPFYPLNKLHSSYCRADAREFCVPTGKLCIQYCANVERYAQNYCVVVK